MSAKGIVFLCAPAMNWPLVRGVSKVELTIIYLVHPKKLSLCFHMVGTSSRSSDTSFSVALHKGCVLPM